jgi:VWFA-related protein
VAGATLAAQAPKDTLPEVVIQGGETALLRLEAVVTDKHGRPVTDLTSDDFVVYEEGQKQTISHFQAPAPRTAPAAAPLAEAADATSEEVVAEQRHIVLALDDLHLSPTSLAGSKAAMKRFVDEQVSDEDEVAVVTTSGNLGLYQAFTQERFILRRAIDRLSYNERRANAGGRATMSEYEAQAIDRGDREALRLASEEINRREQVNISGRAGSGLVLPRNDYEAIGQARTTLAQALEATNMTLGTLETVVRGLGPVSGRKLLVLVSDGFLVGLGSKDPRTFDMRRVFDASARAGVAVYCLDSLGLQAEPVGGDASKTTQPDPSSPAGREAYKRAGEVAMRDSMSALAEGTGGFLVHGSNDLSLGLGQILRDSDARYLLAYSPENTPRDGRFRSITIKLPRHPELVARTRRGYFAPDDGRPVPKVAVSARTPGTTGYDPELRKALGSLVPLEGVPLQMTADFVDQAPDGAQVLIRATVDLNGMSFEIADDRRHAQLEFVGIVYAESGLVVGEVEGHHVDLDLTPATYQQMLKEGLHYQKTVPLRPGMYQVRLVAREERTRKMGSAFQWVEIPDVTKGTLTLSSVFLFADKNSASGIEAPTSATVGPPSLREVQGRRVFEKDAKLYYWLYAYNPVRDERGATDVVVQTQIWAGTRLQGASPVESVVFAAASAPPTPLTGRVALEGLEPGQYELRVLVVDRKAKANAMRRVPFSVG